MRISNHFYPNHFALKQRLGATRKWPINIIHLQSELVVIKALVVIHGFSVNYVFFSGAPRAREARAERSTMGKEIW